MMSLMLVWLIVFSHALAYDATDCARKNCGCAQPDPANPCIGSLPPAGDCFCYTDFTIEFEQTVNVYATNLDSSCGGGRSGWFIIRNTDWSETPYRWDMGGPAFGWSDDQTLPPGTYRLEPSAQWGGTYCVEYWSGPPDCSATLTMSNPNFEQEDAGDCTSWRTITFSNDGNVPFTIDGITSGDPVFQLDLAGVPTSIDPGDDFTFHVQFCPPAGLTSDTPYSEFITVNYICNAVANSRQLTVSGHVPRGLLDVVPSFYVGEVDWTLPSNSVQNDLRIVNAGDAPMTVTATLTDDAGGVFSLPSGGSVGSINGGSRNLAIRATVTAEADYTGSLRVNADYGGGFSDSRTVTLTAKGHHPVPHLDLYTTEIDYGEVEIGYEFRQAVNIGNSGDAPLSFQIRLRDDPTDPDVAEFTLDLGIKTITAEDTELFEMSFRPSSNGAKDIFLVIDNTNEPTSTSRIVRLHGSGTDPIPLSTILVIDRSGSMSGAAGDAIKIEAARDAGLLYTELVRNAWDWLGITKYNHASSTPVPLDAISSNRAAAQTVLSDITGELNPSGGTGIGGAMETAASEFASSPSENAQAMILLTDGKENKEPYIVDVKDGIQTANPNLRIFCVGIGDPIETGPSGIDGIETSKLRAIADDTDALFRVIRSISGEDRYALEAFYFKVFAKATGRQMALDPTYLVPLTSSMVLVSSVEIVSCDRDADFLIVSDLFRIPGFEAQLVLQDPTGQIIIPGATIGGIGVHIKSGNNFKLFRLKFPDRSKASTYVGTWKLYLMPMSDESVAALDKCRSAMQGVGGHLPIAFMVAVGSDYRLEAHITPGEVLVGQPLHITAKTTEAWWPNPDATVSVTVNKPDGSQLTLSLYDDGLHGDGGANDATFGLDFTGAGQKGYYEFLVRSQGVTTRGESVVREEYLAKYVGKSLPDRPTEEECIPCWLLRLIIVVALLLLLLIFIWLVYCCRCQRLVKEVIRRG